MIENHRVGLKDQTFQSANPANQLISRALQWSIPVFVEEVGNESLEEVGDGVVAEAADLVALEEPTGFEAVEVGGTHGLRGRRGRRGQCWGRWRANVGARRRRIGSWGGGGYGRGGRADGR